MVFASGVVMEATWFSGVDRHTVEDGRGSLAYAVVLEVFLQEIHRILHLDARGVHNFFRSR